ncbi:MAG TPA: tRNA preQ1(34) S-adenosylmethionine ribosyltransferase-isomerase QueA [Usitatibacteraceae bacterium]
MKLADFDYELPPELIAQQPAAARTASRLLHLDGATGVLVDRLFADLPSLLAPNDVLVFNDTRVLKARLSGRKETGGSVEVLIERVLDGNSPRSHQALAHVRASKSPKPGSRLLFADDVVATMVRRVDDLFELHFEGDAGVYEVLERHGQVPLPPYITHQADAVDELRYQTVYARHQGSVAAPTAGLHFDRPLLDALQQRGVALAYVTLHVGAGTFQPVRDDDIGRHIMHSEWYRVPPETVEAISKAKRLGGRVIAVGTTSLRTLEAAAREGALRAESNETRIFITPGHAFNTVDRLITNFHLPKSTLMMLVSAFAGHEHIMAAYRHAVTSRYRFFSYGDAMLLEPAKRR